jgi:4-diphosphocytidyl-2-C-methyl-D-erythritol kinase
MLAFPNAKINLGLRVLSRRADGYHTIESCLFPIPWRDIIEIVEADSFSFKQSGLSIPGDSDSNLCVVAYKLLKDQYKLPPVHIHLHKVIPMGAGLGGGSSDGSFTLKLLNAIFDLKISSLGLQEYAAELGSDCPFFIDNTPALATGTGTFLAQADINLSGYYLAVIHPDIHVSTTEAYAGVIPNPNITPISNVLASDMGLWSGNLINDFEQSVFKSHPQIAQTKDHLFRKGAIYAAMSGSGSAVFGLFTEEPSIEDAQVFMLR